MKVIVIGAGAAGLGIGWRLAQRGAEVVVIERAQAGHGATWAAAGMIAAAPKRRGPSDPLGEFASQAAGLWPAFAAEVEEASGHAINYRVVGELVVALTANEQEALALEAQSGDGELLEPESARGIEPRLGPAMKCALWDPRDAKVDNRALGPALAAAFVRAGGTLLINETVVRFEMREGRIHGVRTPFAVYQGDAYVLAAGAWSARIEGLPKDALPPVEPVKGEMLALQPPAGEALSGPAIGGTDLYLVAQREHLLIGATVSREGFDSTPTAEGAEWLFKSATALIPSLRNWQVAERWAGLRPGSPDDRPILGRSTVDELFVASGQFRNGILYAPAVADALSTLMLDGNANIDIRFFDPRRFAAGALARHNALG